MSKLEEIQSYDIDKQKGKYRSKDDMKLILKWTIYHRLFVLSILLISSRFLQQFDSSASLQLTLDRDSRNSDSSLLRPLYAFSSLRWDILHFLGVASPRPLPLSDQIDPSKPIHGQIWSPLKGFGGGLQYENSIAFQPGIIWLLRLAGYSFSFQSMFDDSEGERWNPIRSLWITSCFATIISIALPLQFYL